jgi:acyl dehydratase
MRYFEDYKVGDTEDIPGWTVTKDEIISFASEYDPQPFHLDEDAGEASILGGLAASGWHICCALIRMIFENPAEPTAFLGSPGVEEVRWRQPMRPGDTIRATAQVLEARASKSKPVMGLVKKHYDVFNQDDVLIMTMETWAMIARRPDAQSEGRAV